MSIRRTLPATALAALLFLTSAPGVRARTDAATQSATSRATGTVKATTQRAPSCPPGHTCQVVSVACPGITSSRSATVATGAASGTSRGVVVLLTGGSGSKFWGTETTAASAMVSRLRTAGLQVVQVRWHQSWLASAGGEAAGSAALACRPASLLRWIHDMRFVPMKLTPANDGRCGFCVSGTSGGSSATAYALSHYGLDTIIDAAFPVSGPPHVAVDKGCAKRPGEEGYWYDGASTKTIDSSYGYPTTGPCPAHDQSFASTWAADGIEATGSDYAHPATRIHFLVGSLDPIMAKHLGDYTPVLQANGTAFTAETVRGMGHDIVKYPAAVDRLYALLVA